MKPPLTVPDQSWRPSLSSFQAPTATLDPMLRGVLLIAGLTIAATGLSEARPVVVPMLLAFSTVLAVQPLVDFLERRGSTGRPAAAFATVALLLGLAAFGTAVVYGLDQLISNLTVYEAAFHTVQNKTASWLFAKRLYRAAVLVQSSGFNSGIANQVLSAAQEVPRIAGYGLFVLFLSVFMLLEKHAFRANAVEHLGALATYYTRVSKDIQHFLGVKTLVSLATGVAAGLWCWLWGVPNPALWGVLALVLKFVPFVGSAAAAVPPVLLAVATGSNLAAAAVVAGYIAINLVIGFFLETVWLGKACGLSPLVVLVSMTVWGGILGPVGAILSVPLTCAFRIGLRRFKELKWLEELMANDHQVASTTSDLDTPSDATPRVPPPEAPAPRYQNRPATLPSG